MNTLTGAAPDRPAIPPLTSLRFFAAALVVAFHYEPSRFTRLPDFVRDWLETGYEAVTFFFILSGFVLSYVYFNAEPGRSMGSLRSFFVARFGRLFPAYYVSLFLALPFFVAPSFFEEQEAVSPNLYTHGALVLLSLQSWWPPAAVAWNPPGWSVSVEWFLYAAFPLIAWISRRTSAANLLIGSFLLVVAVAAVRVIVLGPLVEDDPQTWWNFEKFFPLFHLPQFMLGVALGRVHLEGPRLSPALAGWMFAIGLVGLMVLFMDLDDLPSRMRSNAVVAIFFGLLIFGAAQPGHMAYRALSVGPLVYLGNISYSIYAVHQPLEFWWEYIGPMAHDIRLPATVDFLLLFLIIIGVSALSYRYIETPLRRRIRRWADKKR